MEETKIVRCENIVVEKEEEHDQESKASIDVWRYVFGFVDMAVIKCAIELNLPEAIESHETQPVTLTELSAIVSCPPPLLHRIMRFLVHQGIFQEQPAKSGLGAGYSNTPLSRLLMKRAEKSKAQLLLLESSPVMIAPFLKLSGRVSGNETPPFDAVHGKDLWAYAAKDPGHSELFNEAMACDSRLSVVAVVEGCGDVFDGVCSLVDVGGGNGTALGILVKAFPWVKGINFDLPHVVEAAHKFDGVVNVGGDMFAAVPKSDAVFIKWVLHDWGDEECVTILKRCREAIAEEKGKVIIVEAVVGEEKNDELEFVRLMLDMVMMAHTSTGKERTLKEWDYVLKQSGFKRFEVRSIKAVTSVIVAYP